MTEDKTTNENNGEVKVEETPDTTAESTEVKADAPAEVKEEEKTETETSESKDAPAAEAKEDDKKSVRPKREFKKNFKRRPRPGREKPEFEQKIVSLRRVTRVMAGGRRFSFSAAIVIGDKKGRVGFGIGKANDTTLAIEKAIRQAKKEMITVKLAEDNSIPHDVTAKYKSSEIFLRPVKGKGLAVGGAVRTVLELAGVDETGGKILSRSKNNINNSKATIEALMSFAKKTPASLVEKKPFKRDFKRRPGGPRRKFDPSKAKPEARTDSKPAVKAETTKVESK